MDVFIHWDNSFCMLLTVSISMYILITSGRGFNFYFIFRDVFDEKIFYFDLVVCIFVWL